VRKLLYIFIVFTFAHSYEAQVDPRLGYDLFKSTNYLEAIMEFKKQLKVDPKDSKALYHLGLCYLNTNVDKTLAIPYFEKAIQCESKEKDILYYLASAYAAKYDFPKAIDLLNQYKSSGGKYVGTIPALIENYNKAAEMHSNPLNVTFENLGDKINSVFPDYYPFVSQDENAVVFTGRRDDGKGTKEFDGYYPSDIFVSKFDGFRFSPAKPLAGINTVYDESCVGIDPDGKKIYIYYDNYTNPTEQGDIYFAEESSNGYGKKKKIPEGVNDPKSIETSFTVSSDGNVMVFASNRNGGETGLDLFMCRKLPNGKWALAQRIAFLSTNGNEDFPSFGSDGQTLYFASNGRGGMGGYDLFKTTWNPDENTWSEPENLGYPLNTAYDDRVICFGANGKHAYVSQVLTEGLGDYDIYRVTYEEVEINPAIYKVSFLDLTTNTPIMDEFLVTIYDAEDNIVGEYTSNEGKTLPIIFNPGIYYIEVECEGYALKREVIKVTEFDYLKDSNTKSVFLTK
jgi:hypothetical protein